MENFMLKLGIAFSAVLGFLASRFNGWDKLMEVLVSFMVIDIILRAMSRIFGKVNLSQCGGLKNSACAKGVAKKIAIILCVYVACVLDSFIGNDVARNGVIVAFSFSELLSIIENLKDLGVPVPPVFKKVVKVIEEKAGFEKEEDKGDKE